MSKIFYDDLIVLDEIEAFIKGTAQSLDEKTELWKIVDEIIHQRVMEVIMDNLPRTHHEEFLEKFTQKPFDQAIFVFINEKTNKKMEELIKKEAKKIESEILKEIKSQK